MGYSENWLLISGLVITTVFVLGGITLFFAALIDYTNTQVQLAELSTMATILEKT